MQTIKFPYSLRFKEILKLGLFQATDNIAGQCCLLRKTYCFLSFR